MSPKADAQKYDNAVFARVSRDDEFITMHARQRNAIPVRVKATVREGHGKLLQPNINVPSTTVQKFAHENSMSHNWPPETMMSGKIPAQEMLFDHPSVMRLRGFTQ